jgi:sodium-dependent dicarboxylate transporter 2/3/5
MCKGLSLAIAYGCNIGGIATLTGTPPNLVFKGIADE